MLQNNGACGPCAQTLQERRGAPRFYSRWGLAQCPPLIANKFGSSRNLGKVSIDAGLASLCECLLLVQALVPDCRVFVDVFGFALPGESLLRAKVTKT
ncbi:hypothetical protein ACSVIJ_25430, partial [Pseudomonas sp. NCHU5208]|uniref:hypothetical protein n=1 Tax=Pseudomonas sp. NCHU5232 TaxID=3451356 RepID=UPI003F95CD2E